MRMRSASQSKRKAEDIMPTRSNVKVMVVPKSAAAGVQTSVKTLSVEKSFNKSLEKLV